MQRLTDSSPARWIRESVIPLPTYTRSAEWELRCHHVLPTMFEAYAKVFHPLFEDSSVQDRRRSWDEVEKARPPAEGHVEKILHERTTLFSRSPDRAKQQDLIRLRWEALARQVGLPYGPELTENEVGRVFGGSLPSWLWGPAEGDLCLDQFASIGETLLTSASDSPLYALWDVIVDPSRGEVLLHGTWAEVQALLHGEEGRTTPTYWWPDDRRWCVATDWDLTFTLVGGPAARIEALVAASQVESLRVRPETIVLRG